MRRQCRRPRSRRTKAIRRTARVGIRLSTRSIGRSRTRCLTSRSWWRFCCSARLACSFLVDLGECRWTPRSKTRRWRSGFCYPSAAWCRTLRSWPSRSIEARGHSFPRSWRSRSLPAPPDQTPPRPTRLRDGPHDIPRREAHTRRKCSRTAGWEQARQSCPTGAAGYIARLRCGVAGQIRRSARSLDARIWENAGGGRWGLREMWWNAPSEPHSAMDGRWRSRHRLFDMLWGLRRLAGRSWDPVLGHGFSDRDLW